MKNQKNCRHINYAYGFLLQMQTAIILISMVTGLLAIPAGQNKPGNPPKNRSREEIHELEKLSKKVYQSALKMYKSKKYWDATQELIVLIDYFPEFSKIDGVYYHVAQALNELEMNKPAQQAFKWLILKYPQSEFAPPGLLGLLNIAYRQKNYKDALSFYYTILKKYSESDVLDAARYYAGQSYYNLKKWDQAILLLKRIESTNEYYDYALYTISLCMIKKKRIRQAVEHLNRVVGLPVISKERRKIVDDARLTLGFIYYELGYAKEAYELFSDVSSAHPNYMEALLGQGWSKVKLNLFEEALSPLKDILSKFPGSAAAEESFFLLGHCYMNLNRYDDAMKAYEKIIQLFPKHIDFAKYMNQIQVELTRKEKLVEQLETDLLMQESQLLDALPVNGMGKQPGYLEEERKKIQKYQDMLVKEIIKERTVLKELRHVIDLLREKTLRQYQRKDWRGYAEYGRARCLYLKEIK